MKASWKGKKIIVPRPLSDTTQSLFIFLSNPRLGATKLNALLNRRANTSSMRENNFQREESIVIFDSPLLGTNLIHEQYFMGGKSIVPSTGILPETLRWTADAGVPGRYWSYCRLDNNVLLSWCLQRNNIISRLFEARELTLQRYNLESSEVCIENWRIVH